MKWIKARDLSVHHFQIISEDGFYVIYHAAVMAPDVDGHQFMETLYDHVMKCPLSCDILISVRM